MFVTLQKLQLDNSHLLCRTMQGNAICVNSSCIHLGVTDCAPAHNKLCLAIGACFKTALWHLCVCAANARLRSLLAPAQVDITQVWLHRPTYDMSRFVQVHGKYIVRSRAVKPDKAALDDATARRLWDVSCDLTGMPQQE